MHKRWIIPLVIIAVILLAGLFRYNIEATKAMDDEMTFVGVLKWERDRWTGNLWVKGYSLYNSGQKLATKKLTDEEYDKEYNSAIKKEKYVNTARDIILAASLLWLIAEIYKNHKNKNPSPQE